MEAFRTHMQCLHRFCSDCIEKSLRWVKKECPTCRKPCPSRRSLRRDAVFDSLIELVCGSGGKRQEYEDKQLNVDPRPAARSHTGCAAHSLLVQPTDSRRLLRKRRQGMSPYSSAYVCVPSTPCAELLLLARSKAVHATAAFVSVATRRTRLPLRNAHVRPSAAHQPPSPRLQPAQRPWGMLLSCLMLWDCFQCV